MRHAAEGGKVAFLFGNEKTGLSEADHAWATLHVRIPMADAEPLEPYAAGLRTRSAPQGLHRYTVQPGSAADGAAVADLGMGEHTWLNLVRRDGELLPVRRDTRLHPGDQVLAQVDDGVDLGGLFRGPDS